MPNSQVVIVTGGAHGIGRGIAEAYVAAGAQVIVADVNEKHGKETESHLIGSTFIPTDVKDPQEVDRLVKQVKKEYGQIDVLVNNAGISKFMNFFDMTIENWEEIIQTNLRSVFVCSQAVAKVMKEQKSGGSIVNIASTRALMSEANTEAYSATKGGIVALTHALSVTLSDYSITVNAISPGWIEVNDYQDLRKVDHEQHLSNRVGKPSDIAKACLYLTDPQNDFVTGTNLVVDGGMTRKMIYEH
ncbi:SDR family oxidoreductase [Paenisporosarcina cavernae]|uniref:SDR family oxidoreductase n=1 Tax=Paenisporosarcina cavernae TaxID=2320858 RepID=A0A385YYC9_9BACL|nr:SDR family oxidoreductase [Paenisporosarcina cavernae]AYC30452.1 SDR family oxidoreductase [Paenisporosarcina cavernae]